MIMFNSDYLEGGHPAVMDRLLQTNMEQTPGYGEDAYSLAAADKIRAACGDARAAVHFLVGGTQTNLVVIAAALRPYQGVIAASTGHINVHETGAIEAAGHKVITLPEENGKIGAAQIAAYVERYRADPSFEHIVMPKMVYLSYPTELGSLYSRRELEEIHAVCERFGLYLYIDGARLAYGLAAARGAIDLPFLAKCASAFYIGGTKVGALFGEAVVITDDNLKEGFRSVMKQRGGLLAKGRLLGVQFDAMFTDGLYDRMGRHAIGMAQELTKGLKELGCRFMQEPETNQIFIILPDESAAKLAKSFGYEFWEKTDEHHTAIRLCTSWATKREQIESLLAALKSLQR